jgi:Raf kinase inhibitor-like YbhB/YbcL family protein
MVRALLGVVFVLACQGGKNGLMQAQAKATFSISTPAFQPGGTIPKKYTCEGRDLSPPLAWTAPPAGTESFVLMVLDPDAPSGTWTHWLIYDLPATVRELPENTPATATLPSGGRQGRNDFGHLGFGGPCPPPGRPHRYFFRLFALNVQLGLKPGATRREVEQAVRGHILAQTELVGRFGR